MTSSTAFRCNFERKPNCECIGYLYGQVLQVKHIVASVGSPSTKSIVPSRGQNKVPCEVITTTTTRSSTRTLRQVSSGNGSITKARVDLGGTISDVASGVPHACKCCRRARQNTHTTSFATNNKTMFSFKLPCFLFSG